MSKILPSLSVRKPPRCTRMERTYSNLSVAVWETWTTCPWRVTKTELRISRYKKPPKGGASAPAAPFKELWIPSIVPIRSCRIECEAQLLPCNVLATAFVTKHWNCQQMLSPENVCVASVVCKKKKSSRVIPDSHLHSAFCSRNI